MRWLYLELLAFILELWRRQLFLYCWLWLWFRHWWKGWSSCCCPLELLYLMGVHKFGFGRPFFPVERRERSQKFTLYTYVSLKLFLHNNGLVILNIKFDNIYKYHNTATLHVGNQPKISPRARIYFFNFVEALSILDPVLVPEESPYLANLRCHMSHMVSDSYITNLTNKKYLQVRG